MSQSQIQTLELLAYTNNELRAFLYAELISNPCIDLDEGSDNLEDVDEYYEHGETFYDTYYRVEDDNDEGIENQIASEEDDLLEVVLGQLNKNDYSEKDWEIFTFLTYCLDDWGFLPHSIIFLSNQSGYSTSSIKRCLEILKRLEPIGIFSRNVIECLLRQIDMASIKDEKLRLFTKRYLPYAFSGKISQVAKRLNLRPKDIKTYLDYLSTLNPRPLINRTDKDTVFIIPDILVRLVGEEFEVEINDNFTGEFKYNNYYINMLKTSKDKELKAYIREKYNRAKFFLKCVEQRRETIIKITKAILEIQGEYFLQGKPLRPMNLEAVADLAEVHSSTVSRAIKNKYIQYKEVVAVKDLFSGAIGSGEYSASYLRESLKDFFAKEKTDKPLSDNKIAKEMEKNGIRISRRTVAKYREQLGIPESRQRVYIR
jgi:RNA polymerase sigma-54 factor